MRFFRRGGGAGPTIGSPTRLQMSQRANTGDSIALALQQQVMAWKFRMGAPIWRILEEPHNLVRSYQDAPAALLTKLMNNIYHYGRRRWTWTATGTAENRQAFQPSVQAHIDQSDFLVKNRWTMGRGLLDGTTTTGACGDFNNVFAFLAKYLFRIPVVIGNGVEGQTMIGGNFITMPGVQAIDSHWIGNVWSDSHDNDDIRAFEFYGHYFCWYGGRIYDVTGNRTYGNTREMIWCKLEAVDDDTRRKFGGSPSVYRVIQQVKTAFQPRTYCVNLGRENLTVGGGGFSNWLLTDRTELAPLELRRFARRSSRG